MSVSLCYNFLFGQIEIFRNISVQIDTCSMCRVHALLKTMICSPKVQTLNIHLQYAQETLQPQGLHIYSPLLHKEVKEFSACTLQLIHVVSGLTPVYMLF